MHDEGSKKEEEKAQQDDWMRWLPTSAGEAGEVSRGQEGRRGNFYPLDYILSLYPLSLLHSLSLFLLLSVCLYLSTHPTIYTVSQIFEQGQADIHILSNSTSPVSELILPRDK